MGYESPYVNFDIPSFCYLDRAKKQLRLFDSGVVESLFYCALDLRFGIEARLFEYIEASSSTLKNPLKHSKDYVATKLLKILSETNPDCDKPATLVIGLSEQKTRGRLDYTPVTEKLASYHGKLGGMLHSDRDGQKSLLDYRDFLDQVIGELEYATSGDLLAHPTFTKLMKEADEAI